MRGYQGDAQSKQLLSYKLVFISYFSLFSPLSELVQAVGICFLGPNFALETNLHYACISWVSAINSYKQTVLQQGKLKHILS